MNPYGRPPIPLSVKMGKATLPDKAACWPWPGKRNKHGYGVISHGRRDYLAHRVAAGMMERVGEGVVRHNCDNPPCVNPAHLTVGTHADNVADTKAKKRFRNQKKTHCVQGHALKEGNLYTNNKGHRICATCARAAVKRYQERK
jgi:HNH endonuclease